MMRNYVLDLPDEELGPFSEEMQKLVCFKPGQRLHGTEISQILSYSSSDDGYVETDMGTFDIHDGRWLRILVSKENIQKFERLLDQHSIRHLKNPGFYSLCCSEANKNSKGLFLLNYHNEKLLFISSDIPLFLVRGKSYIPDSTPEDERLERAIIQDMIDFRESGAYAPHTDLRFFPSVDKARKHIDITILDSLEESCERGYDGAILYDKEGIKKNFPYRFPHDLTNEKIKSGRIILLGMLAPEIVKVYPDGTALVSDNGCDAAPLDEYSGSKGSIKRFEIGACERCCADQYKIVKERMKDKTLEEIRKRGYFPYNDDFAEKVGYKFDPDRIKVRIFGKKPMYVYSQDK